MSRDDIVTDLSLALNEAAPTNQPETTRGIPGGAVDWDKIAEAIVTAVEDMLRENTEEEAETETAVDDEPAEG